MAAYGFPFPTWDLDFVTRAEMQPEVVRFLEGKGFSTLYRSQGFSNHAHAHLGRVDFVYVRGETAEKLFLRMSLRPGPGGRLLPTIATQRLENQCCREYYHRYMS